MSLERANDCVVPPGLFANIVPSSHHSRGGLRSVVPPGLLTTNLPQHPAPCLLLPVSCSLPPVTCLLPKRCGKRCRRLKGVAQFQSDPSRRIFIRLDHRKFSERLHPAHSRGQIHCTACIGLPEVRQSHRALRQYPGPKLAHPRRQMPQLQNENFGHVSRGGIPHRDTLPGLLFGFWPHGGRAEVGRLRRAAGGADHH